MTKKLLLTLVLPLVVSGVIFYVWKQQAVVAPTIPEPVVPLKPQAPQPVREYSQHIEAIPGNTDEVWYNIPEYGVRMKLNKGFAEDLLYLFVHEKNSQGDEWDTIYLSLVNLEKAAPGCGGYGVLTRSEGNLAEMKKMKEKLDTYIATRLDQYTQAGSYYYGWTGPQDVCWDPSLEKEVRKVFPGEFQGRGAKNILEGVKTLEVIPQLDTSNWKIYRNEKFGFELKYPVDWSIDQERSNKNEVVFNTGLPGSREAIYFEQNIRNMLYSEWVKTNLDKYAETSRNEKTVRIADLNAHVIETGEFAQKHIIFSTDQFLYRITSMGLLDERGVLRTFRLLDSDMTEQETQK